MYGCWRIWLGPGRMKPPGPILHDPNEASESALGEGKLEVPALLRPVEGTDRRDLADQGAEQVDAQAGADRRRQGAVAAEDGWLLRVGPRDARVPEDEEVGRDRHRL